MSRYDSAIDVADVEVIRTLDVFMQLKYLRCVWVTN